MRVAGVDAAAIIRSIAARRTLADETGRGHGDYRIARRKDAAADLGISERTLYRKIREYNIKE